MTNSEIETIKGMVKGYEDSLQKIKLKILIFGPGKGNPDGYAKACFNKRLQIKQLLTNKDHDAILPEEAFEEAKRQGKEYPNITAFEKHLIEHHCDIALFLYIPNCPGVDHELSVFSVLPDCVQKIYCFHANDCEHHPEWPPKDKIDFICGGKGHLDSFCKNDIDECNVSKKVLEISESVRRFLVFHPYKKYKASSINDNK